MYRWQGSQAERRAHMKKEPSTEALQAAFETIQKESKL